VELTVGVHKVQAGERYTCSCYGCERGGARGDVLIALERVGRDEWRCRVEGGSEHDVGRYYECELVPYKEAAK
jgi:hypothetical protein